MSTRERLELGHARVGERLDKAIVTALRELGREVTRSQLARAFESGRVWVEGAAAKPSVALARACVVEQLNKLNNFSTGGLTGPISLDNPKGQAVLPIKLFQTEPATASVKALTDFIAY